MVSHNSRAVLCAIVLLLICGAGGSVAEEGLLTGVIKDGNGAVIPGAAVRIQHWIVDSETKRNMLALDTIVRADEHGHFEASLASGAYDVFISYFGLTPVAKKVRVLAGNKTVFDAELAFDPLTKYVY